MRRILSIALISIPVVFSCLTALAADFQKGLEAARAEDYSTTLREWEPLAQQGNADAQYSLGSIYYDGKSEMKDDLEAAWWYRLAAKQGHARAQFSLSLMYYYGEGVLKDDVKAMRWLRLAAEQGHARAQLRLGLMYAFGKGTLEDIVLAHMWLNIAGANGQQHATEARDLMEDNMTPKQISDATQRAKVCRSSSYRDCD